jgi:hypothetical protein
MLRPTNAQMPRRWNTLRASAWGFWVGLIYGVADQFFLSDYEDDFLSENTVSSIAPILWAAVCGAVLFALVSAIRNAIAASKVAGSQRKGPASAVGPEPMPSDPARSLCAR